MNIKYFLLGSFLAAQVFLTADERINITERTDFSKFINGKYAGLTYREAEMYLIKHPDGMFSGEAFVLQETKKNMMSIAKKLDAVLPIKFNFPDSTVTKYVDPYHPMIFTEDNGYPILRNFPVLPKRNFAAQEAGMSWIGKSTVVVQPHPDRNSTRVPIIAEYKYQGLQKYLGKDTHYIKAVFAVRYKRTDPNGDNELVKSEGRRDADIYLDTATQAPVFIREKVDEEFLFADNSKIRHKGFILHFYDYSAGGVILAEGIAGNDVTMPSLPAENIENTGTLIAENTENNTQQQTAPPPPIEKKKSPEIKPTENFSVTKTERGTVLNLQNLNFIADKAELLAGEDAKLASIADILKSSAAKFFFVEGHTADIGNHEEQQILSELRAKTIVDTLTKLGIPAKKFIYKGSGGEKPIADNSTQAGRAKNRRVEITIME